MSDKASPKGSHFVPKFILNNFMKRIADETNPKLLYINTSSVKVDAVNSDTKFKRSGLYLTPDNDQSLVTSMNDEIENDVSNIVNTSFRDRPYLDRFEIGREDLRRLKRYVLLQTLRTPNSKIEHADDLETWFKMLNRIVKNPSGRIVSDDIQELDSRLGEVDGSSLLLVKASGEFVITDLGCTIEMIPSYSPSYRESQRLGRFCCSLIFTPLGPEYGIILADGYWRYRLLGGRPPTRGESQILANHLDLNEAMYVNGEFDDILPLTDWFGGGLPEYARSAIGRRTRHRESFVFRIHNLSEEETDHLNRLMLKNAEEVAFRNRDSLIRTFESMNELTTEQEKMLELLKDSDL